MTTINTNDIIDVIVEPKKTQIINTSDNLMKCGSINIKTCVINDVRRIIINKMI